MRTRDRFTDDLAGVAGGAFSIAAGLRREVESLARSAVDDLIARLELVPRAQFDAVADTAAAARSDAEALRERLALLEARVAALEADAREPRIDPL